MFHIHRLALSGYEKLVNSLGANPIALLAEVGISQAQLRETNVYLPLTGVADLLELTAQRCKEPLFGTRLATVQGFQMFGELGISTSQQSSVLASLNYTRDHGNLIVLGMRTKRYQCGNLTEIQITFDFDNDLGLGQVTQLNVVKLYQLVKYLAQASDNQLTLLLRQAKPVGTLWQWDWLKNYVNFNSAVDGIRFPSSWLEKQPQSDTHALQSLLTDRVQLLQSKYPNNLEKRITHTIAHLLPSGECSISLVAKALELHPRTLQEQLQRKGLTFTQLLQQTRLQIAKQKLQRSNQSITELALSLGYADIAVFSRNFKKWTGHTPTQFRCKE